MSKLTIAKGRINRGITTKLLRDGELVLEVIGPCTKRALLAQIVSDVARGAQYITPIMREVAAIQKATA